MTRSILIALAALCAVSPTAIQAQDATQASDQTPMVKSGAEAVAAYLKGERKATEVFSAGFLAAVPTAQLDALTANLTAQFGAFQSVASIEPKNASQAIITLRFANATVAGPMTVDRTGKISGLLFNDVTPMGDSLAKVQADLSALPGAVSALYVPLDDGAKPLLSLAPGKQLAIGSAFKLYVLSALAHAIERGEHRWDEVIKLDTRSLPSGQMQEWPANAPVTLHTLASMMISISDNTAADQLIRVLGREAISAEVRASGHAAPERMQPFLNTLELFALKGDPALGARYAGASREGRATLLEVLDQRIATDRASVPLPTFTEPQAIDTIEWFASPADQAGILRRIVDLDDPTAREILSIAPSLPASDRNHLAYVGYKGGSEPGVLDLTWLVQTRAGQWRMLALTWNDPAKPVDVHRLEALAMRLLKLGE